jgi:uncharacterized phage protein (TIGR01671 family)
MNNLEFRIWDKSIKSMIYTEDDRNSYRISLNGCVSSEGVWCTQEVEVMQFTGLLDKNGRKIFEGDIVKLLCEKLCEDEYGRLYNIYVDIGDIREITMEKSCFITRWIFINEFNDKIIMRHPLPWMLNDERTEYEIIGNIFENYDILKEQKHPDLLNQITPQ